MKILFGLDVDAGLWPKLLGSKGPAMLGRVSVGPLGLLDILEPHLGLGGLHPAPIERALALVGHLRESHGFWSASLDKDPIATARVLIGWRDELRLAGWDAKSGGERLCALGTVCKNLAPGLCERLEAVTVALGKGASDIEEITLLEDPALMALAWRRIFEAIGKSGTEIKQAELSTAQSEGDLAKARVRDFAPAGDGSLVMLRPYGPMAAAEELAAWLARQENLGATVIIGGDDVLDAALHRYGLPTLGGRGADQSELLSLLGLVLEMGRDPIDPEQAARLLNLGKGPVPAFIARRLAGALAEWPAVGSKSWNESLKFSLGQIEDEERRAKVRARVEALFLPELPRGEAYPVEIMLSRVALLEVWLRGMEGSDASLDVGQALQQVAGFRRLLRTYGQNALGEQELQAVLRAASRMADDDPAHKAQAGLASIGAPGALVGPAKTVVWWDFTRQPFESPLVPLEPEEHAALLDAGVELRSLEGMAASMAAGWRRPFLQAQERMILVCPERDAAGEETHPHPAWDELEARLAAGASADALVVKRLEATPRSPRDLSALPRLRYRYQVGSGRLGPRDKESPSSLEKLIGCPLRYVFQYAAKLYAGASSAVRIKDSNQLQGSMAHAFIADALEVFKGQAPDPERVARRVLEAFDEEGPRMAAMLFLPEQRAEKAGFVYLLEGAARDLSLRIVEAGQRVAGTEKDLKGQGAGVEIAGRADLLLDGPASVLDLKRSWASVRRDMLREGKALQLATYSRMHRGEKGGDWPPVGYYVLDDQRMLTTDQQAFGKAERVAGPSPEETWRQMDVAMAEVWRELGEGLVRLGLVDKDKLDDEGEALEKPWIKASCRFCDYGVLCGRELGGL